MMDTAKLEAEAAKLVFPRFTEDTALRLGLTLVELAKAGRLPVVIDIRTADRTLFHAALPGSAPLNDLWALSVAEDGTLYWTQLAATLPVPVVRLVHVVLRM